MKKTLFFTLLASVILGGKVSAQDCEKIVLPLYGYNQDKIDAMDLAKLDWRCRYAYHSLYESDTIPAGVPVYEITEVKNKLSNEFIPADIVIDRDTFSYYAYDFDRFRVPHPRTAICFRTPNSNHPYLILRSLNEIANLVGDINYNLIGGDHDAYRRERNNHER